MKNSVYSLSIESIACLPPGDCRSFLDALNDDEVEFFSCWPNSARADQRRPSGAWRIWLFLGGRGAGKTRAGAEWIADGIHNGAARRVALIGATHHDARAVMIEGESGLLRASDSALYEPSNQRVLWPSGAVATVLSAEEPDGIRGHQFDAVWGDVQAKLSKHAAADTASLLFQTNASGRAELGLAGDDNFRCKVSPDGAAWTAALTIDRTTGACALAPGSASAPALSFGDATTGLYGISAGNLGLGISSAQVWTLSSTGLVQSIPGGGISQINVLGEGITQQNFTRYSNDTNPPIFNISKGRGSIVSRTPPALNDGLGVVQFSAFNGTAFTAAARIRTILIETGTIGPSAMGGQMRVELCPIGSGAVTEVMRIEAGTGISMFGANPVIDQNRGHRLRSTTIAAAIAPSLAGILFYHSDAQGGAGEVAVDTGSTYRYAGQAALRQLTADADAAYTPRADGRIVRDSATLTADRKLTLTTANVTDGHKIELSRRGSSGGHNRAIYQADGTTLIANVPDNSNAAFVYDGVASLWFQI